MENIKRYAVFLKAGICFYIIYCLIFNSELVKKEIWDAIDMWINIIVPSVFPYLVISGYIASSDMLQNTERILGKILAVPLGISICSIRCVICSFICGYPSGAICAYSLYEDGKINKEEAQRLICYTNNAGPLFLISAVGTGLLGSYKYGVALYIIQLVSSFIYGIISRGDFKNNTYIKSVSPDICLCIKNAVTNCVNICGFMIASYVISGNIVYYTGKIIPDNKLISALIKGIFEISAGVKEISLLNKGTIGFAIICFFVSWSGISVILQIKSVSGKIISIKKICLAKLIQAFISFILGYGYAYFCGYSEFQGEKPNGVWLSLMGAVIIFIIYIGASLYTKKKAFR